MCRTQEGQDPGQATARTPPGSTAPLPEFPAWPPVSQANARPGHRSRWQIKQTYSRPQAGVQWWDPILSWPGCCVNQDGCSKAGWTASPRTEEERWGSALPALQQAPLLSRGAGKGSSGPCSRISEAPVALWPKPELLALCPEPSLPPGTLLRGPKGKQLSLLPLWE